MVKTIEDAPGRYSAVARFLHWLVLALLVLQFAIAWTIPDIYRGTLPVGLVAWHLSVGTLILAVMVVRLGWRLSHPAPLPPFDLQPALRAFRAVPTTSFTSYCLPSPCSAAQMRRRVAGRSA